MPRPCATSGRRRHKRGRLRRQRGVCLPDQLEQVAVQVELPGGDQVDDRNRDLLLEQGRALGHKRAAVLGPVLVGGADDLDGSDQATVSLCVVNPDLVLVLVG